MFVLKSTLEQANKLAKAACISRDLWRSAAKSFEARAIAAEEELARRKAHALRNLKQNRKPKSHVQRVVAALTEPVTHA